MRLRDVTIASIVLLSAGSAIAQDAAPAPDISITARVRARELRFERVPNVDVKVTASINGVAGVTVDRSDRQNLPEKVQPNVTYRDVGIILTITSTLPDIDRILDEALGPQSRIPQPPKP